MNDIQKQNIGIVSLGLIGGSILKSLSFEKSYNLYAVTRNEDTINKAKKYTNNVFNDMTSLKCCDVIFVCSPMSKTIEILDKLENIVPKQTIVADVCSLKEFVMKKKRPYSFIGSHPMAGTEKSGFDASFSDLFQDAKWILTPSNDCSKTDISKLTDIISKMGAKTLTMDPISHDKAVALVSHMPMLISQALMKTVIEHPDVMKVASSGFRDMTRLAMSNVQMANDMIRMNSVNISSSLIELIEQTRTLLTDDAYIEEIKSLSEIRSKMYNSEGKNISN